MLLPWLSLLHRKSGPAIRPPRAGRRFRPALEQLEARLTPSTLIPITTHRDLVFDATRNQLDITTSDGKVQRWDVASQSLLSAYSVGNYLYASEGQTSNGQGVLHKLDLATGAVTNLAYSLTSGEVGSYAIALGSN